MLNLVALAHAGNLGDGSVRGQEEIPYITSAISGESSGIQRDILMFKYFTLIRLNQLTRGAIMTINDVA